ncbi:MAG: chemotaxis protein CheX [Thermodesulfobacteriota bacterium]
MKPILLNDCSREVSLLLADLLDEKALLLNERFENHKRLDDYRMIVLETRSDQKRVLNQISKMRYACNFRNIPIIVMRGREDHFPVQHYIMAGATEVLSLTDPPAACRQILQGYLIPDRRPLDQEMEYLKPFIENTVSVIQTMTSGTAEFREMYFSNAFRIFGDISGIIGLSGDAEGTVVLTFYWALAWRIISKMMQVQEEAINAELIHDGVGELINMISGSTKKNFVGTHYHYELSLPTVVVGSGHQIGHPEGASIAILIFDMDNSSFAVHVCLKPMKGTS